jgi:hypothetical protein
LKDPGQPAYIITSSESLFLQAEAVQRGFLPEMQLHYTSRLLRVIPLLGVANYATAATTYTAQAGDATNFTRIVEPDKNNYYPKMGFVKYYRSRRIME